MSQDKSGPVATRLGIAWLLALLSLAYVAWCHQGLAPSEGNDWWQPSSFLQRVGWLRSLGDDWFTGADVLALTLPAGVLCAAAFAFSRSVMARTLTVCAVTTSALLGFYGLHAFAPWEFFGWRGSLTLIGTGFVAGTAAATPLFASRWLRAPNLLLGALYTLGVFAAIALMRHSTGWDEALRFNLSPWPAVAIFGIDFAGHTLAGVYLALGLVLAAPRRSFAAATLFGAACLITWVALRFGFETTRAASLLFAFATLLGIALLALKPMARAPAGASLLVGGLLLAVPVFAGRALASGDHAHTRYVLSPRVITALQSYYEREQVYPNELGELVSSGDLASIPRPRIGFDSLFAIGLLEEPTFGYHSMGSSYVLDFSSTEWVQCAYTPPWIDEDEPPLEEEEEEEPWACPDAHPDLW